MGDSAATIGVLTGGTELGAATLNHHHHHTVTKAVHEAEDLPVVSENGKLEPIVESPQGAPASPASPSASPPCSPSVTPPATPDTEAQAVTSSQTSHTKTLESAVSLQSAGGGLQGAVQSQDVQNLASQSQAIHSQSIQSGSVSQSHITTTNGIQPVQISTAISGQPTLHSVSQSHTTQAVSQSHSAQTVVQSHAAVGSNGQPLSVPDVTAEQPRLEPPSVDENANSIPEVSAVPHTEPVPEAFVAQEANEEPVPAVTSEPSAAPEPAVVTEPAATPEQAVVTEPAAGPEPVTEPKPAVVEIPAVTPESAEATEEAVIQELDMPTETAMVETMVDAQESAPNYEPESLLVTEETAAPEPQPARMPIHEEAPSSYTPEPVPALKSEPSPEADPCVETVVSGGDCPVVEEISQEHIKEQLHEIITEIEQEVLPEQEQEQELEQQQQQEDGSIKHTWKPRGRYEVPKTVVQAKVLLAHLSPNTEILMVFLNSFRILSTVSTAFRSGLWRMCRRNFMIRWYTLVSGCRVMKSTKVMAW
ncbi:Zinc metalloprotease ZmpB [Chionoecetes opilio]|uniref:Zinc metalloprotease ZmpB n=1 Tax=Chionoecetes opilio TaxID=41210 RepID=A0A8J4Y8W7_CHIOP|nr:Zinc metalloprotease ZmpB [Chionoecetes opilio]